jgi:predicted nucleic acid-binding protein
MIVVDTNVIWELMRPDPAVIVVEWLAAQPREDLFLASVTIAEILYGVELLPQGKRRAGLLAAAEATFTADFSGRILPFEEAAAHFYAKIAAARRARGRPIAQVDAQIAAIARVRGAVLATRNTPDFEGCGIRLINPWLEASA